MDILWMLPNGPVISLFFLRHRLLEKEVRDLPPAETLLRPAGDRGGRELAGVLLTGETVLYRFYLVCALVICISIYFNFQMLTDVAALVEARNIYAGGTAGSPQRGRGPAGPYNAPSALAGVGGPVCLLALAKYRDVPVHGGPAHSGPKLYKRKGTA